MFSDPSTMKGMPHQSGVKITLYTLYHTISYTFTTHICIYIYMHAMYAYIYMCVYYTYIHGFICIQDRLHNQFFKDPGCDQSVTVNR